MSSAFSHRDIVAQSSASLLTARRLRALRTVLCDDGAPQHLEVVALADLLIDVGDTPVGLGNCVCGYRLDDGARWDGVEYVHDGCEVGT